MNLLVVPAEGATMAKDIRLDKSSAETSPNAKGNKSFERNVEPVKAYVKFVNFRSSSDHLG